LTRKRRVHEEAFFENKAILIISKVSEPFEKTWLIIFNIYKPQANGSASDAPEFDFDDRFMKKFHIFFAYSRN